MWKASAGGVNKKQARGNFCQECKESSANLFFLTKSRQKLGMLDIKDGESQGLIELYIIAAAKTLRTSLYLDINS